MNTPAARRWSKVIDEQEASGLTVRAFAQRTKLNAHTLSWWRSKLKRKQDHRTTVRSQFIEVDVVQDVSDSTLSLHIENLGVRVDVDQNTDLDHLRDILLALC